MKVKLLFYLLYFVFQFGFSQTEKLLQAKVFCEDFPLQGIEILNLASKKTTITDTDGKFSILAKAKDTLMFISKNYEYKRLVLKKEDLSKNDFVILLIRKPEQLEEVVITKTSLSSKGVFSQEAADEIKLEKGKFRNRQIYDGTIENGADLMRIGGMILKLFVKEKEMTKNKIPEIKFKELATATCTQDYFNKTLQLKPEEVALFLEFCDADPKSKTILENANPLNLMDFLFDKNTEFKKLQSLER